MVGVMIVAPKELLNIAQLSVLSKLFSDETDADEFVSRLHEANYPITLAMEEFEPDMIFVFGYSASQCSDLMQNINRALNEVKIRFFIDIVPIFPVMIDDSDEDDQKLGLTEEESIIYHTGAKKDTFMN